MYRCDGRFVSMVELNTLNDKELFILIRNEIDDYQNLVSHQCIPDDYQKFKELIKIWFLSGRTYQFLVYRKNSNKLIGTVFFYNHNKEFNTVKFSVFFSNNDRKTCSVAESLGLAVSFAYNVIGVRVILFSVYEHNNHMLKIAEKLDLKKKVQFLSEVGTENVFTYEINEEKIREILAKLNKLVF